MESIHSVFKLGSSAKINNRQFRLDDIMIIAQREYLIPILGFVDENKNKIVCYLDIETNMISLLEITQQELYYKFVEEHEKRLLNNKEELYVFKADSGSDFTKNAEIFLIHKSKCQQYNSQIKMNENKCDFGVYSYYCNNSRESLIISVSKNEMDAWLSKQALYDNLELKISLPQSDIYYAANIVRIENVDSDYILYSHPYSIEVLQVSQCKSTTFENINNPFSVMDFMINYADSDVSGIVYPNSDKKPFHNYIVVGVLQNLYVDINDCVVGNVRVGNSIDTSEKYKELVLALGQDNITYIWVNVKADSLYSAFVDGQTLLSLAADFMCFMLKNDMYADWFGKSEVSYGSWDVRSHNPKIQLGKVFYIENCMLGESVALVNENNIVPSVVKLDNNSEYMFEQDWIEYFFRKLQMGDKKLLRLRYALKWINQAWNANDKYDRVIYCSMALEFIVNGEKGKNIFDEYAMKVGRKSFTKSERKLLCDAVINNINLMDIDDFSESILEELNDSIRKMIYSKLCETNFRTKLEALISRLHIPITRDEIDLLNKVRKIRNELIHGINMSSISTLEIKKLCGIISRILIYKIMDELDVSEEL